MLILPPAWYCCWVVTLWAEPAEPISCLATDLPPIRPLPWPFWAHTHTLTPPTWYSTSWHMDIAFLKNPRSTSSLVCR
jgi:hypothetical protein